MRLKIVVTNFQDVLLTGKSDSLTREQAQMSQVEVIFERVITELVQKMREMNVSLLCLFF